VARHPARRSRPSEPTTAQEREAAWQATRVTGRRVANHLIDVVVFNALLVAGFLAIVFLPGYPYDFWPILWPVLFFVWIPLIWVVLWAAVPYRFHGTLGMLVIGLRIVDQTESDQVGFGNQLVRGLLFVADAPVAGLVGLIVMLNNDARQRVGDMAAKTYVIDGMAVGQWQPPAPPVM
jgi:uncharacterized RDD family membrane protein YckC